MSNEMIVHQQPRMSLAELKEYGQIMAKSGVFKDVGSAERAIVKIEIGRSFGVDPATALRNIHVFDGKVELGVGLISLLIKRSKLYDYHILQHSENGCAIQFMHVMEDGTQKPISWQLGDDRPKDAGISKWTKDDTKRACLDSKDNHKKYGAAMNFARALTQGARWFCPDIFGGSVYAEGEISDRIPSDVPISRDAQIVTNQEGEVIGQAVVTPHVAKEEDVTDVPFESVNSTPPKPESASTPPDPEPPKTTAPKPLSECSKEELTHRCKLVFAEAGISKEQAKRILARKGVAKLSDLTEEQLREMISKLFDKMVAKGIEQNIS